MLIWFLVVGACPTRRLDFLVGIKLLTPRTIPAFVGVLIDVRLELLPDVLDGGFVVRIGCADDIGIGCTDFIGHRTKRLR